MAGRVAQEGQRETLGKEDRVSSFMEPEGPTGLVSLERSTRMKIPCRMGAAVLEYRRALAETQDSVPIMNRLSAVLTGLGREEEALQLLQRAKEISPDHPTTYTHLGQAYLKVKDFAGAKEAFLTSIQINPFNPGVHRDLATACEMLGERTTALQEREIARRLLQ